MIFEKKTESTGKYYVYVHIRIDINSIFYVGIGTKYNHKFDYTRAKSVKGRNYFWQEAIKETPYKINIIFESDDYDLVKNKEIELIEKYGRLCLNNGLLTNIANGGAGNYGVTHKHLQKPIYLYNKNGEFFCEFPSFTDCAKFLKVWRGVISIAVNKNYLIKQFILKTEKTNKVSPVLDIKEKLKTRLSKPVYQYDRDLNLLEVWESSSEAGRILKIQSGHIRECCLRKRKTAGNFIWSYEK